LIFLVVLVPVVDMVPWWSVTHPAAVAVTFVPTLNPSNEHPILAAKTSSRGLAAGFRLVATHDRVVPHHLKNHNDYYYDDCVM
jgi:hypothetical protein